MDPKGDRLRKIQSGQLKLPDSVLKSNSIVLTTEKPRGGGGCLEGGPRPRASKLEDGVGAAQTRTPIILATGHNNNSMTLSAAEIPLPSPSPDKPVPCHADIPLPDAGDIPLPVADMGNIPLPSDPLGPKHDDIPLPSNESIPLPADKPASQRRIKVSLSHLEPRGDELLCRSCVMTFAKQIEYDIHLQSDAHQQAIKSDLPDGIGTGASLLNKRPDKSPSHDGKSGHVSFSFKKHGPRITITQPFVRREEKRTASPVEIKLLKPEMEKDRVAAVVGEVVDEQKEVTDNGDKIDSENDIEKENGKIEKEGISVPETRLLMSDFVKVQSKDDSGRVLDWPKEMIQYTDAEPKLMFSCNPLSFDFSQLFAIKKQSKTENNVIDDSAKDKVVGELDQEVNEEKNDDIQKMDNEEKKKSRKKKKKKKHKKHKTTKEIKEGEEVADIGKAEEEATTSKKKKKKHKRKHEDKEAETTKESVELNSENADEKDKEKKSKKKKKKSKQSDVEGEKVEEEGDKKHKKRKKKKSKKKKKKHHGESEKEEKSDVEKEKGDSGDSGKESDGEKKEKESKKKKKKRKKHKRKEGEDNESSESESERVEPVQADVIPNTAPVAAVSNISVKKRKFPDGDSDGESDKIVAKIQALSRTKIVPKQTLVNNLALQKRIKKEPVENAEKKTPSERKRVTSESSVNESTPIKKVKVTPKASGLKDNIPISLMQLPNVKVEKEESWSKIETQTTDNVKSKWDTSDSDADNALNETMKKEKAPRKRTVAARTAMAGCKAGILKDLKSPGSKNVTKIENEQKKVVTQSSSQRSNKSNVSAGSAKLLNSVNEKNPRKSRKVSVSPASSHSRSRTRSRGRRRSYSVSESSSRSRSRSYSSSSDYSDDSRHSRRHRHRRSSSRSYSRSSSRSRSRSYHRRRGRSSSSEYSRSRSYSSSRSRSRSHRRNKRSYTRSRSRSYSSSSSSYSSRSRNRSRRSRKNRRRRKRVVSRRRTLSKSIEKPVAKKKEEKEVKEKVKEEKEKVDPGDIPLPDLSGKKDDERSEEKLKKLKEKARRGDVGETVAKLVESLPADIPLPFSEGVTKTVSSDSLPSGPPSEALKENDTGFIGPKMPAPPPPPPMGRGFPPNHGPPGPPRPGWGGQWDHWDAPGPWDGMGPWDGPGPRQPYRGMRPPYDPRMYGPYDPRRRGPPPYMNRPRGPHPYMGPRYPGPGGPHGPHPDYMEYGGYDYGGEYEHTNTPTEEEPAKNTSNTPPPLPKEPPKDSSPKPPLPKKKVKELEPEQNPDIVIPPEQAEQYKHLQKQAQKHARRQLRRQAKRDLGEPDEDSTSSESEPEEQPTPEIVEEVAVVEETPTAQLVVPQVMLQPQPTGSPSGAYIIVSGGQQYIVQKPQFVQAGSHLQAAATGQPVMVSQGAILSAAHAAASGAQPAHIVQQVPAALSGHPMIAAPTHITAGGVPVAMASAASIQHMQQVQQLQQMHQIQQIQQIQQAQAIQAHNQAVAAAAAAQHGQPIVVGGRILVPTLGVRPAM